MKITNKIILILSILFLGYSCSEDDGEIIDIFGAAFDSSEFFLEELQTEQELLLVFNKPATEKGTITIDVLGNENINLHDDFSTIPAINENNKIVLNFNIGDLEVNFTFSKLIDAFEGLDKIVTFTIEENTHSNSVISGNTDNEITFFSLSVDPISSGTTLAPNTGGPNQNNSVYIDLSLEEETVVKRDIWDLGFYSGNEFKVLLNSSIGMGAGVLTTNNIDAVTDLDTEVQTIQSLALISTNDGTNVPYFDTDNGDLDGLVISEVFENESDNKVYIVNLGFALSNVTPEIGSAAISGDLKGWKKIRVLRNNENYILQYADLNDTTHQEVTISKNELYNFNFFDFETNTEVIVEPEKDKWDLHFTPFNQEFFVGGNSFGFIFFSDIVLTNGKSNVSIYLVDGDYDTFNLDDVNNNEFSFNHSTIGNSWRSVFSGTVTAERFYVLKDTDDNVYKIEFTTFLGTETDNLGQRGFPKFRYDLLE